MLRLLRYALLLGGASLLAVPLWGLILLSTGSHAAGIGSWWEYEVWQPNGLSFTEKEEVVGLEFCGLRLCYLRSITSNYSTSTLWLDGWRLVKAEVKDAEGNSRVSQFTKGILLYDLPLRVGKTWKLEDTVTITTRARATFGGWVSSSESSALAGIERRVMGEELVEVPAGRFMASIVEHYEQNGILVQRIWFNETVDEAVMYVYGLSSVYYTRWVLLSYGLSRAGVVDFLALRIFGLSTPALALLGSALIWSSFRLAGRAQEERSFGSRGSEPHSP